MKNKCHTFQLVATFLFLYFCNEASKTVLCSLSYLEGRNEFFLHLRENILLSLHDAHPWNVIRFDAAPAILLFTALFMSFVYFYCLTGVEGSQDDWSGNGLIHDDLAHDRLDCRSGHALVKELVPEFHGRVRFPGSTFTNLF